MELLNMLMAGFYTFVTPANILACVAGVLLGTLIGVLPGIGPVGAMSILLPLSFNMDVTAALILFFGIYYGAMYGGSTTSILLNVPGESASVVTCIDGHAMAKKGRAGAALTIAAIGSFIAGSMGLAGLTLFAPPLAMQAVKFGPPENFAVALLGLLSLSGLTAKCKLKAALMIVVGVMLSTIGMDSLTGITRFSANIDEFQRGIDFAILAMGLFGISEVLDVMTRQTEDLGTYNVRFRELYPSIAELKQSIAPIFRGGIIGFMVGLIPGPAATISTFASYAVEKRLSPHPEEFGQGAIEGVAGPESANNAAVAATMIPLLALGLPFAPASALLISGFMLHGIVPGPTLMEQHPDLFWGLIVSMYVANVLLLIVNLPLVGIFANILRIPANILHPFVLLITMTGAYSINHSLLDVALLIGFGALGLCMKRTGYDPVPLMLGFVLGPIMERGLSQGLIICNGNIGAFFTRPISGSLLAVGMLVIAFNIVRGILKLVRGQGNQTYVRKEEEI